MHIYTAAQAMNSNMPAAALSVPNLGTCTLGCRNLRRQLNTKCMAVLTHATTISTTLLSLLIAHT